jgi:hypothetical protein
MEREMSKSYHKAEDRFESKKKRQLKKVKQASASDYERRMTNRARHWLRTGVSKETVEWMEEAGML